MPTFSPGTSSNPKPGVACLRCREQKLKCDRALPACTRCRKQCSALCTYPPPPDRRKIAQETLRNQAMRPGGADTSDKNLKTLTTTSAETHECRPATAPTTSSSISQDHVARGIPDISLGPTSDAELPPTEIGSLLLEIYFKRVYNATLLFHKTIALQLYARDGIPDYLLRAIFAQAAVFLKDADLPQVDRKYVKTYPMPALFEKSWSWARSASRFVLACADEPNLERTQALQVLHSYYFARGDYERADVHAALAYELNQILGHDKLLDNAFTFSSLSRISRFDHEVKRRSFWASWCTTCIAATPPQSSILCESVAQLPLPAEFESGGTMQGVDFKLSVTMNEVGSNTAVSVLLPCSEAASSISLMAELVILLGIWTQVQTFVCASTEVPYVQRESAVAKMNELLGSASCTTRDMDEETAFGSAIRDESIETRVFISSLRYLSRILLHASMVPTFSDWPIESTVARAWVHNNAEIVLQEALKISRLYTQYLAHALDVSKLCPFNGYAAFVAGTIFLEYSGSLSPTLPANCTWKAPGPGSTEFKSVKVILDTLSIYWEPLRSTADKLEQAVRAGNSRGTGRIDLLCNPWNARHRPPSLAPQTGDEAAANSQRTTEQAPISTGQRLRGTQGGEPTPILHQAFMPDPMITDNNVS